MAKFAQETLLINLDHHDVVHTVPEYTGVVVVEAVIQPCNIAELTPKDFIKKLFTHYNSVSKFKECKNCGDSGMCTHGRQRSHAKTAVGGQEGPGGGRAQQTPSSQNHKYHPPGESNGS